MKYCTWCGKPGPENAEICPIDGHPMRAASPPPIPLTHRLRAPLPTKLAPLVLFLLGAIVFFIGFGLFFLRIFSFTLLVVGIAMMASAVGLDRLVTTPDTDGGTGANDSSTPSRSDRDMKCTWCGKEYPAGHTVCPQDQRPLEPV